MTVLLVLPVLAFPALAGAGSVTVHLVDNQSGAPLEGENPGIFLLDLQGGELAYVELFEVPPGTPAYFGNLEAGSYLVFAGAAGRVSRLWPNTTCPDPYDPVGCDFASGGHVVVGAASDVEIELRLDRLGHIVATVTGPDHAIIPIPYFSAVDHQHGTVRNVQLLSFDPPVYVLAAPLGPFHLVVRPSGSDPQLLPVLHDGSLCFDPSPVGGNCPFDEVAPLDLGLNEQIEIEVELPPAGKIEVHSADRFGIDPSLRAVDDQGDFVLGGPTLAPLAEREYRLETYASSNPFPLFPLQRYGGGLCPDGSCDAESGTPIHVIGGQTIEIDWTPIRNPVFFGKVRRADTLYVGEVHFVLYDEDGNELFERPNFALPRPGLLDEEFRLPAPGPGRYRLAVLAQGYHAHLVGAGDCPAVQSTSCDLSKGRLFDLDYGDVVEYLDVLLRPLGAPIGCADNIACLLDSRFTAEATWTTADATGIAHAVPLSYASGYFWFFGPDNLEVVLKVLDGCAINQHYWIYAAGLTDVGVDIVVLNGANGDSVTYHHPRGSAFETIRDVEAFACPNFGSAGTPVDPQPEPPVKSEPTCLDGSDGLGDVLCLADDRFQVRTHWRTASAEGVGKPVRLTSDSGYIWFFGNSNVEIAIKVLDACSFNDRFWVYAAGLTDVEVTLEVTDTLTGATKTYRNPLGHGFEPILDTGAFATCGE